MNSLLLAVVALVLGGVSLFLAVWTVLPAFRYVFWLIAVVAGEQGLYFGFVGLIAAGLGLMSHSVWGTVGAVLGLIAFAVSLIPALQAAQTARRERVRLSLWDYFGSNRQGRAPNPPQTVAFAHPNGPNTPPLLLDIYQPRPQSSVSDTLLPCLLIVHGGSWKGGDKSDFPRWNRCFAENGFVVFDIQYRLEPAPNAPLALEDVVAALAWIHEHGKEYGADSERMALLGRSAGGHLALLGAYTAPSHLRPRAAVALYAPTELAWGYHHTYRWDVIGGKAVLSRFLGGAPEEATDAYHAAEPGHYVDTNTPPTLLFHGLRDTLVGPHHTRGLAKHLEAAQVPHRAVFLPWSHHGFDYFFHGWAAQVVRPILHDFLRKHVTENTKKVP